MGIKSQTKNELDDLLNSCVVSPLDNQIRAALDQSGKALEEAVGQRTQSMEKALRGQIGALHTQMENNTKKLSDMLVDDIPNAIQDCGSDIRRDISGLARMAETDLTELKQKLSDTENELEAAVGTLSEIEKRADEHYRTLLAVSLIVGAANLLGVIALALACFLT